MRNSECGIERDGSIPEAGSASRRARGPFRIPHSAFRIWSSAHLTPAASRVSSDANTARMRPPRPKTTRRRTETGAAGGVSRRGQRGCPRPEPPQPAGSRRRCRHRPRPPCRGRGATARRDLYTEDGAYAYTDGVNRRAVVALVAGILVALAGTLHPRLRFLFDGAWFSAAGVSFVLYWRLMRPVRRPA